MPPTREVHRKVEHSRQLKNMTIAALKRMHPDFGEDEIRLLFLRQVYGKQLSEGVLEVLAEWKGE
jgi:hypothetical protein